MRLHRSCAGPNGDATKGEVAGVDVFETLEMLLSGVWGCGEE
jgi:hypothetical protein